MPATFSLSTKQFAQLNNCTPGTVRRHHSDWGHYHGIRPVKQANGDLLWPSVALKKTKRSGVAA